jgi:hypothetical protein
MSDPATNAIGKDALVKSLESLRERVTAAATATRS